MGQQLAGLKRSIFEDVHTNLPQLANERWITTTRSFLDLSQLTIVIPNLASDRRQRENDTYIMEYATSLSPKNVTYVNR